MKIFIMRHGLTVGNEKGITQGRLHIKLSKKGVEDVENRAKQFSDVKIDLIITSPQTRAVQTANLMNKYHNVKIVKNDLLSEINQGYFEGKKFSELTEQELKIKNLRLKEYGMESFDEIAERCQKFLTNLVQTKVESVLIVTHSSNATILDYILNNEEFDENVKKADRFKNAEIKSYVI